MARNPEITEHLKQLEDAVSRADALLDALDNQTVNWRPAPEQWSVAQCLDHLNITAEKYLGTMKSVIANAAQSGPHGTLPGKRRLLARLFIWVLEPPARVKAKVPASFAPSSEVAFDELRETYAQTHTDLRRMIEDADGVSLDEVKVLSPVTDKINFRVGEAFAVILAHERRHLTQAENVVAKMKSS